MKANEEQKYATHKKQKGKKNIQKNQPTFKNKPLEFSFISIRFHFDIEPIE